MRGLKLLVLAAFALLALGAASVPGASAAFKLEPKACDGTITAFCWEAKEKGVGLQELVGEEEVVFTQEKEPEPLYESTNAGKTKTEEHILCESAKGSGTVRQTEPLVKGPTLEKAIITFEHCKLLVPAEPKCTIEKTQKTNEFSGELTEKDVLIKPTVKNFIEMTFKGEECLLKGTQAITGEVECLWLPEALEKDAETQLCEVTHEDGGLKLGASSLPASLLAEFEVLFPLLEKEDIWDVGLA